MLVLESENKLLQLVKDHAVDRRDFMLGGMTLRNLSFKSFKHSEAKSAEKTVAESPPPPHLR